MASITLGGFTLIPAVDQASASTPPGPLVRASRLAEAAPSGARATGATPASQIASIDVVLAPSNPTGLDSLLSELYSPSSPLFHHWLTPTQFADQFGPSPTAVSQATAWLKGQGLDPVRSSTFAFTVKAPASRLAAALGTSFENYRTTSGATGYVAQGQPLVPTNLNASITSIQGLSSLPAFHDSYRPVSPSTATHRAASSQAQPLSSAPQPCQSASSAGTSFGAYTMDELGRAYGVDSLLNDSLNGAGQTIAVYELSGYGPTDIAAYENCFGLSNHVTAVNGHDGGPSSQDTQFGIGEADLDIEQEATQAPGSSIISYQTTNTERASYDLWADIVKADRASVISTSWAECEPDANAAGEFSTYKTSYSTLFEEAAADGQTVLAASGDSGSEGCAQDFGESGVSRSYAEQLAVSYPASDPFVTAVGGTDLYGTDNDTVWNDCGSSSPSGAFLCSGDDQFQAAGGGGESTYMKRPSWEPGYYNWATPQICGQQCREVPDLSANAGIPMVDEIQGQWGAGVGTSYSAPLVAGLVADRNQGCTVRTGNLAPILYSLADVSKTVYQEALFDVTSGNNDMLAAQGNRYGAATGYDLASGLGTPHAQGLACAEVTGLSELVGNAGDTVTVTGLGLEDATIYFGNKAAAVQSRTATSATVTAPSGPTGTVPVTARYSSGAGTQSVAFTYPGVTAVTTSTTTPPVTRSPCFTSGGERLPSAAGIAAVRISGCNGYFVVDAAGKVSAFGDATWHGDLSADRLGAPIIAIEATPDGQGYWLLGSDGGVFAFGDANFFGSTGGIRLNAPVVGMAVTPTNHGYWIVAKDGGVFSFGDARFYGSTGNLKLVQPVDGIAVAPGGSGYWLVAADGGVFTFTRDGFYGSLGGVRLAKPIVGMSSTPDGRGYTLVGSDGGVFSFGDAPFYGSLGSNPPATPIVDLSPAPGNNGYYLVSSGGVVYAFGPGAHFYGNA
jgi:hypothetical protein